MRKIKSFFCKSIPEKNYSKVDLDQFVETALVSIVKGVERARLTLEKSQGEILPIMGPAFSKEFGANLNHFDGFYYQQVEFELAVTVENKSTIDAKVELKIPKISVVEASFSGGVESKNATISHIKFHVPIGLSVKRDAAK